MDFEELLNQLVSPPEEGFSPTIYDDLRTVHSDAVAGAEHRIGEQSAVIAAQELEISRLKGINFDLMTAIPSGLENGTVDETEPDEAEVSHVSDLFESKE